MGSGDLGSVIPFDEKFPTSGHRVFCMQERQGERKKQAFFVAERCASSEEVVDEGKVVSMPYSFPRTGISECKQYLKVHKIHTYLLIRVPRLEHNRIQGALLAKQIFNTFPLSATRACICSLPRSISLRNYCFPINP